MSRQRIVFFCVFLAALAWNVNCDRKQPMASPQKNSEGGTAQMDAKEKELASLPVGIEVTHSPNPAYAQKGGGSGHDYTWMYKTAVKTKGGPLAIEEFGSFAWRDGRWVLSNFTGKPFTPQDFAEWYSCPDARLEASTEYADPQNWSGSKQLKPGKMRWYFIARDEKGRRVKGEGVIEQRAELASQ